jgi:proton-coupled amino acid transporter
MTAPPLEMADSKDEKPKQPTKPKSAPVDDGHSHEVSGDTVTAAIFGIVKAMVGPAILYLPHSFADAGYAFAIVALWICTAMYLYTSQRLLSTWRYVKSQQAQAPKQKDRRGQTDIEMTSLVLNENPKRITKRRSAGESDDQGSMDDKGEVVIHDMDQEQPVGNSISYPQLARIAYGEAGENAVRAGITLMQLGVCLTYCKPSLV